MLLSVTGLQFFLFYALSCVQGRHFINFFFRLGRGCRQGYLISPYLFLSCVKILTIRIKKNENITEFKFINTQYYLSQFADLTSIILDGSEKSSRATMKEIVI